MAQKVTVTRSGRRLTEADFDRLADQAEAGFDLSTWQPRRGRPRLEAGATEHAPRIAVRVPQSLHRQAVARAKFEGRTLSAVVRDLLRTYAEGAAAVPGFVREGGRLVIAATGTPITDADVRKLIDADRRIPMRRARK